MFQKAEGKRRKNKKLLLKTSFMALMATIVYDDRWHAGGARFYVRLIPPLYHIKFM